VLCEIAVRAGRPDFGRFEAQLRSSGYCARPVHLQGVIQTCDGSGQRRIWSTDDEPDGILRKACGNRREAICGPCAERYRQDAYHLIAAGLRGGKGVPDTVVAHPCVFVTLTAPTFGPVHTRALDRNGKPRRCRPRRNGPICEHGRPLSCGQVHADGDACLGEPLCLDCFDHRAAVAWNNSLPELWRRTTIYLPRVMARLAGMTQKRLREEVRPAFMKVAEYQQRGLVHLHVVIRLDRAMPAYRRDELHAPPARFDAELLEDAIRTTVGEVRAPLPDELGGDPVGWGAEIDVRHLAGEQRGQVAGYLAKYATKSTEQAGGLLQSIDRDQVERVRIREHVRHYLRAAFDLDDTCRKAARDDALADSSRTAPVAAETARDPSLLARRGARAMSIDERVRVRLHDGRDHTARIVRWAARAEPAELELNTGEIVAIADVKVIAAAEPRARRNAVNRRFAACAHQFGYRGHCLTKSRRYSTTFAALRQAREQHVREQLLARSADTGQRALSVDGERIARLRFAGQGHLTAGDALLAASGAARRREHRRLAREERLVAARDPRSRG
jgi:hypothetical protein